MAQLTDVLPAGPWFHATFF